jgi:hypothetical protein
MYIPEGAFMAKITIRKECEQCKGTGVMMKDNDTKGVAYECALHDGCGGKGYEEVSYTPFTGLKRTKGIDKVREWHPGSLNLLEVNYEDFLIDGGLAKRKKKVYG